MPNRPVQNRTNFRIHRRPIETRHPTDSDVNRNLDTTTHTTKTEGGAIRGQARLCCSSSWRHFRQQSIGRGIYARRRPRQVPDHGRRRPEDADDDIPSCRGTNVDGHLTGPILDGLHAVCAIRATNMHRAAERPANASVCNLVFDIGFDLSQRFVSVVATGNLTLFIGAENPRGSSTLPRYRARRENFSGRRSVAAAVDPENAAVSFFFVRSLRSRSQYRGSAVACASPDCGCTGRIAEANVTAIGGELRIARCS